MNKIHPCKVSDFLSRLDINQLGKQTGFTLRKPKKITAELFIVSFFNVMLKKCYSLRQWAIEVSLLTGKPVSFQAIAKKLQFRQLRFIKALLLKGLDEQLDSDYFRWSKSNGDLFKRILIEDSTCIQLPHSLSQYYPGNRRQNGPKKAVARIQLCLDLLSNSFKNLDLKSFCDHDATHSTEILNYLKQGDLVLRDLGYSKISVFRSIIEFKAYFISRLHPKWVVLDADNEKLIDLMKELKDFDRRNLQVFDRAVKIGRSEKFPVRIVGLKLSQKQAQIRRRKACRNGNRKRSVSQVTSYLLGWNILVTNLDKNQIKPTELYKLYSLRWHIEMIFKNWKSYFKIADIFTSCQGKNYAKPEYLLYLCMCFLVFIYNPRFNHFKRTILLKSGKILSPAKFAKMTINNLDMLLKKEAPLLIELLQKNCCYAIRKDRQNIYERILYI